MSETPTYELVYSPTPGELSQMVSDKIDQGWWPLGTPFVHGECYAQAMVTEKSDYQGLEETTRDE